ncbi:S41 family peptidase [Aquimarina sp. RZ0]|uniref:S41 family peptidase n=1 Tax=Aquimarina sp. RZ0 TaxID=2607730 RepID=UPI0011F1A9D8|nr:S41 family peptidase [Aquimarina sp. RZ0]KAA1248165.1 hypothetical protein F0000_00785 [Aquimarina sp. RZ0]
MNRSLCIVFFLIISSTFYGQRKLTNTQAREDFKILQNILLKGHPALYDYIDKRKLDSTFKHTEQSLPKEISDTELLKKILVVTNHIKDGNLLLFPSKAIETHQYYFPLILKIINTEFYTDTHDFGIPIGSKISKINTIEMPQILEKFRKYTPTDGYILTRKYRDIELKFGLFHLYEFGIQKEFTIEYIEPNGTEKSIILPAESFTTVKKRNLNRNSYVTSYHHQEDKVDFFSKHIHNKEPYIYYKDKLKTAVLVINSFSMEFNAFKSRLTKIFREIDKNKIKNLIIDIRDNDGGFRPNVIQLFSLITQNPYKQRANTYVTTIEVPEKQYVTKTYLNEKDFFKTQFYPHPTYDGWQLNFDDLEALMVPDKNRFKGNVYTLIGGATYAAGSTFALLTKNDPNILLIGEETGSGYYSHTGDFPVHYELPNSKITMVIFLTKITSYIKNTDIPKGSGVPPDRKVPFTVEDLKMGKDTQLEYTLKLIGGGG